MRAYDARPVFPWTVGHERVDQPRVGPDKDLAYLIEGSAHFKDYVRAVSWAQKFAYANREAMMERVLGALRKVVLVCVKG